MNSNFNPSSSGRAILQLLLELAQSIFKENTSLEKLMEQIMTSSLEIVNCETSHTFLCSQVYLNNIATDKVSKQTT